MKRILTILLATVLCIGSLFAFGCSVGNTNKEETPKNEIKVYSVRMAMGSPMTATTDDGQKYIEKTLTATVLPSTATNKKVDFIVEWDVTSTLSSEPVSDYITVVQDSDGSTTGKVRCFKDFGDNEIIITVRTRDGGFTDTCICMYEGLFVGVTINTSNLKTKNTAVRGDYYELLCGQTYTLDLTSTDMFNDVTQGDYSVSAGGFGESWMMHKSVSASSGGITRMPIKQNLSITTSEVNVGWDTYFSAKINESNQLEITTNSDYILSANERYFSTDNDGSKNYIYYKETISSENFYVGGQGNMVTPEEYNTANAQNIPKSYFFVNVTDNNTGKIATLKFWIETEIEEVTLDNSIMVFTARNEKN